MAGHAEPHHHILLENGYVRAIETRLDPGEETHFHSHPIDAVVVFLTDSGFRIRNDDGTSTESSVRAGTVVFGSNAIVHRTANTGDDVARTIAVEIFSRPPGRAGEAAPSGEVLLENDVAVVSRVIVGHDAPVRLAGSAPSVVVALSRGLVEHDGSVTRLGTGGVVWCDSSIAELKSAGGPGFEAIVVALKPRG